MWIGRHSIMIGRKIVISEIPYVNRTGNGNSSIDKDCFKWHTLIKLIFVKNEQNLFELNNRLTGQFFDYNRLFSLNYKQLKKG